MYPHVCAGAECPHCSPFALQRPALNPEHLMPASAHPRVSLTEAPDAIPQRLEQGQTQHERLSTFRDSRGEPVAQWPKRLVPSVTVIILHGSHWQETPAMWTVLCQQRSDNGWWGFPGGAQESGESLIACAKREVMEETGLDIYFHGAVCVDSDPQRHAICTYNDGTVQYTNTTFLASIIAGVATVSPESLQLRWCSIDMLPQPFLRNHEWRLAQAMWQCRDGQQRFFPLM